MSELDEIFADIKKEGEDPFAELDTEKETPSESQPEKEHEEVIPEPEKKEEAPEIKEEDTPFHKRWEKREEKLNTEWEEKFESYKRSLESTIEEKTRKDDTTIPDWFSELYGDNQIAWEKYEKHEQERAEAIKRQVIEEQEQARKKEAEESTKWERWVDDEVKKLSDEGLTFDKNELIKTVIDYRPTDDKGNYDLRKAYDILEMKKAKDTVADKEKSDARKAIADTTTKTTRGEPAKKDYMTPSELRNKSWNQL